MTFLGLLVGLHCLNPAEMISTVDTPVIIGGADTTMFETTSRRKGTLIRSRRCAGRESRDGLPLGKLASAHSMSEHNLSTHTSHPTRTAACILPCKRLLHFGVACSFRN